MSQNLLSVEQYELFERLPDYEIRLERQLAGRSADVSAFTCFTWKKLSKGYQAIAVDVIG